MRRRRNARRVTRMEKNRKVAPPRRSLSAFPRRGPKRRGSLSVWREGLLGGGGGGGGDSGCGCWSSPDEDRQNKRFIAIGVVWCGCWLTIKVTQRSMTDDESNFHVLLRMTLDAAIGQSESGRACGGLATNHRRHFSPGGHQASLSTPLGPLSPSFIDRPPRQPVPFPGSCLEKISLAYKLK